MGSPYSGPLFGNGHDLHISSYASISKKSYSSPGWTYIPSFIAFNPGGFTQSFSTGSFYFQRDEVEVFY